MHFLIHDFDHNSYNNSFKIISQKCLGNRENMVLSSEFLVESSWCTVSSRVHSIPGVL